MPNHFIALAKCFVLCCLGLMPAMEWQGLAADGCHSGPLFDHFSLTLDTGCRVEAFGPLYGWQQTDSESLFAIPPLFSDSRDRGLDTHEFDFLYPALTCHRYGTEFRCQLFQLLSFSGGQDQRGVPKTRFTVFPFYFQQRSTDPEQNYTALVPFYGIIKDRLFRDEIHFVLFPLYSRSRKRDVITDNYVYPFFHLRRGDALRGWQFWPLAGHEHKDPTLCTNGFGDTEVVGGHDKLFVGWPIYFNQITGVGSENPQTNRTVLPFYSAFRSPRRDSTSVIWPFFTSIDDREKKYHEWDGPWPFVVFARGEGKTATRILPLFSRAQDAFLESDFYLWPVYKYNRVHSGALDRDRTRILFFLYSRVVEKNIETGKALTRTDLWPLFTHHRNFNGNSRLQILALIEPFLLNNTGIERNWSPLWSVWRSETSSQSNASSQSLLWNLYRRDTTATTNKCSLLFGLFQYQSSLESKRMRLFYIPFGTTRVPADAISK